jgi:hypothetical protein
VRPQRCPETIEFSKSRRKPKGRVRWQLFCTARKLREENETDEHTVRNEPGRIASSFRVLPSLLPSHDRGEVVRCLSCATPQSGRRFCCNCLLSTQELRLVGNCRCECVDDANDGNKRQNQATDHKTCYKAKTNLTRFRSQQRSAPAPRPFDQIQRRFVHHRGSDPPPAAWEGSCGIEPARELHR